MKYRANISWGEYCFWNKDTYGSAIRIRDSSIVNGITAGYLFLAILIPIIVPVPVAALVFKGAKKMIKNDFVYRW